MNIFSSTAYRYAEEDRLTNALISVLEHSDRRVLHAFLKLALPEPLEIQPELDDATFEIQIALRDSRPDACIRLPSIELFIETKRGADLDGDQFRRHLQGLDGGHENTVLVGLTQSYVEPEVVDEVRRDDSTPDFSVGHISWSDVLGMVEELAPKFDKRSATGFLLRQFGDYLEHLGYYCFRGLNMDELVDYGELLMKVARREQTTARELQRLLKTLAEEVTRSSGLPLDWSLGRFNDLRTDKAIFDILTSHVPAFGDVRNPCIRIVPSLQNDRTLRVTYYLTYSNGSDTRWERVVAGFEGRRSSIEDELGPLLVLGQLQPGKLFHVSKIVDDEHLRKLLQGDEAAITEVGREMGKFFGRLNDILVELVAIDVTAV